mmetsp:Transcript_73751/g.173050  ORF Transcript_73751/g.173050 Transcript_73751/m.173050 type:complete len:203 (-) Transcript_73751:1632-2240(-)
MRTNVRDSPRIEAMRSLAHLVSWRVPGFSWSPAEDRRNLLLHLFVRLLFLRPVAHRQAAAERRTALQRGGAHGSSHGRHALPSLAMPPVGIAVTTTESNHQLGVSNAYPISTLQELPLRLDLQKRAPLGASVHDLVPVGVGIVADGKVGARRNGLAHEQVRKHHFALGPSPQLCHPHRGGNAVGAYEDSRHLGGLIRAAVMS